MNWKEVKMEQIQEDNLNKDFVGLSNCFLCGEAKEVILDRRLKKSLPHSACYDKEPCSQCKEIMEQGVLFIGVRDGESGDNPFRTGQIIGLKDEAVKKLIQEPMLSEVLKKRICFVEEEVLMRIGLINKTGKLKHEKKFK